MAQIEFGADRIEVDADVVARGLKISPDSLKQGMREGSISSRSEHGEGEDAGKLRLTFFSATRRVRITADTEGNILTCIANDVGGKPLSDMFGALE